MNKQPGYRAEKPWRACLQTVGLVFLMSPAAAFGDTGAPSVNLTTPQQESIEQQLIDIGISPIGGYVGDFNDNPIGGQRQGSAYSGELMVGAIFDLKRLANIDGGSIDIRFDDRTGSSLTSQTINNSVGVDQDWGGGQTYQLSKLSYNQKLFDNVVDVEVGRLIFPQGFFRSDLYGMFESDAFCGQPNIIGVDTSRSSNPVAVWAGNITLHPIYGIYTKIGIYQSKLQADLDPNVSHGFNWSLEKTQGFLLPVEFGYEKDIPGAITSDRYDIGVIFDRSHFTAPFYSETSPNLYGRTVVYLQAQQMLFQTHPGSPRGVYAFGAAMFGASGSEQEEKYSLIGGAVWQGPVASRPSDYLGAAINFGQYTNAYLQSEFRTRVAEGGTQYPEQNLVMIELNYNVRVNRWLSIMPDFQYIIHPNGEGYGPYPKENLPNAAVFGTQFYIGIPQLLGMLPAIS